MDVILKPTAYDNELHMDKSDRFKMSEILLHFEMQ